MPLLLLLLIVPLLLLALTPVILVQRYRVGTARRMARSWMSTFTLISMVVSAVLFLFGAAITNIWVTRAFVGASAGLALGTVLGALGLVLTRWESGVRALHYTPNRWLVLAITLLVSARVLYGFYRSWAAAQAGVSDASVVDAFGIPESLGAGGTAIGYYLAYAAGLRWRIRRWQNRPLRPL